MKIYNKLIILIAGLIFVIPFMKADTTLCYQESADVATECGGLSTGSYITSGNWFGTPSNIYDGNWSTNSYPYYNNFAYFYVNYTLPSGLLPSSKLQIKAGAPTATSINITLPSACLTQTPLQIYVKSRAGNPSYNELYCLATPGWQLLRNASSQYVFEEAIWWNITETLSPSSPMVVFRNWLFSKTENIRVRHWSKTYSDNNIIRRWRMQK